MSPDETGGQWDFPYAWAPNQLLANEGMRRYGFNEEANRASYEFPLPWPKISATMAPFAKI